MESPISGTEPVMIMDRAYLILEDGTVFPGRSIGAVRDVVSEVVFNTSMAGYTEIMTDPSYAGQSVCMTYPLIGNYGVCLEDMESERPWISALIVRHMAELPSNFRSDMSLVDFMRKYDVPGIEGIDTRKLVRILREKGTMNGLLTVEDPEKALKRLDEIKAYRVEGVVERVSCKAEHIAEPAGACGENGNTPVIALMDFGAKANIVRSLQRRGCRVVIYPCDTKAEVILDHKPDGIMLSNGPGDPRDCGDIIREIRKIYESDIPVFAICLGHQLMALAAGAKAYKLHYGHRGGNHPVKDLSTGRVYISSQNHGYVVDTDSLDSSIAVPSFVNVNDSTNEGLTYTGKKIFTVQFHPEASPGPQDTAFLFDRFLDMI